MSVVYKSMALPENATLSPNIVLPISFGPAPTARLVALPPICAPLLHICSSRTSALSPARFTPPLHYALPRSFGPAPTAHLDALPRIWTPLLHIWTSRTSGLSLTHLNAPAHLDFPRAFGPAPTAHLAAPPLIWTGRKTTLPYPHPFAPPPIPDYACITHTSIPLHP